VDELNLSEIHPAELRLAHAEYFRKEFVKHSGPPLDNYFLMIAYFDAFLFTIASVHDITSKPTQKQLDDIPVFRFFKVLRNITTHHSVLTAPAKENKFLRPVKGIATISTGGEQEFSYNLAFNLDSLLEILSSVEKERPYEKKNIDIAREYIETLKTQGGHYVSRRHHA